MNNITIVFTVRDLDLVHCGSICCTTLYMTIPQTEREREGETERKRERENQSRTIFLLHHQHEVRAV